MPSDDASCKKLEDAFVQAMRAFDESAVRVLKFHLEERYGIKIGACPCSSIEEIEAALTEIAGVGSDILISRMRSFMRQ
jgi:hypothetical protein